MSKRVFSPLVLLVVFLITGCNLGETTTTEPLSVFHEFNTAESYTMTITANYPMFGELEFVIKKDGNKEYMFMFGEEIYAYLEDSEYYLIVKDEAGQWIKVKYNEIMDEENEIGLDVDVTVFDEELFTIEEDKYILKEEYYTTLFDEETAEQLRSFELVFTDDGLKINYRLSIQGVIINAEMIVNNLNQTTVELPQIQQGESA